MVSASNDYSFPSGFYAASHFPDSYGLSGLISGGLKEDQVGDQDGLDAFGFDTTILGDGVDGINQNSSSSSTPRTQFDQAMNMGSMISLHDIAPAPSSLRTGIRFEQLLNTKLHLDEQPLEPPFTWPNQIPNPDQTINQPFNPLLSTDTNTFSNPPFSTFPDTPLDLNALLYDLNQTTVPPDLVAPLPPEPIYNTWNNQDALCDPATVLNSFPSAPVLPGTGLGGGHGLWSDYGITNIVHPSQDISGLSQPTETVIPQSNGYSGSTSMTQMQKVFPWITHASDIQYQLTQSVDPMQPSNPFNYSTPTNVLKRNSQTPSTVSMFPIFQSASTNINQQQAQPNNIATAMDLSSTAFPLPGFDSKPFTSVRSRWANSVLSDTLTQIPIHPCLPSIFKDNSSNPFAPGHELAPPGSWALNMLQADPNPTLSQAQPNIQPTLTEQSNNKIPPCPPRNTSTTSTASLNLDSQRKQSLGKRSSLIPDVEDCCPAKPRKRPSIVDPDLILKEVKQKKRPSVESLGIACNQCRSRKLKCDKTKPKCYHCTRKGEETCTYEDILKRRGPGKHAKKSKARSKKEESHMSEDTELHDDSREETEDREGVGDGSRGQGDRLVGSSYNDNEGQEEDGRDINGGGSGRSNRGLMLSVIDKAFDEFAGREKVWASDYGIGTGGIFG